MGSRPSGRYSSGTAKSLAIGRETGDRPGQGLALWNICLAFERLGDLGKAIANAESLLAIYEEIHDPNVSKVRSWLTNWYVLETRRLRSQKTSGSERQQSQAKWWRKFWI